MIDAARTALEVGNVKAASNLLDGIGTYSLVTGQHTTATQRWLQSPSRSCGIEGARGSCWVHFIVSTKRTAVLTIDYPWYQLRLRQGIIEQRIHYSPAASNLFYSSTLIRRLPPGPHGARYSSVGRCKLAGIREVLHIRWSYA